jgi:hypothetical protein
VSFDVEKIAFLRTLDCLVDYHNLVRGKLMSNVTVSSPPKKTGNRFVSFLDAVGHDFKVGLDKCLPFAATAGEIGVGIFAPSISALFNQTVNAVVTAEQSAAAVGKQTGSGASKLASVVALMGPLIKTALTDAGKPNDDTSVQGYVNAVVTILNAVPVAVPATGAVVEVPGLAAFTAAHPVAPAAPSVSGASNDSPIAGLL